MILNRQKISGTVNEVRSDLKDGNPHSFIIMGDNGTPYFAHLGDIKANEDRLYNNSKNDTVFLKVGDKVEFTVFQSNEPRAINIIKK